jgi:sugar lactone lactonase YvrE
MKTKSRTLNFRLRSAILVLFLIVTVAAGIGVPASAELTLQYVTQWGSPGSGDGQLISPVGIAVDSSGYIYVTDFSNHRIQKFTSSGTYVTQWGSHGSSPDDLTFYPQGIAVDTSGYVYVTGNGDPLIQKFTSSGTYVTGWGSTGSGNGQFYAPRDIAVDGSGYVYVTDTTGFDWDPNNIFCRVQKFTSSGTYVTQWGSYGDGDGQFIFPYGIAVDSNENVYVTEEGYRLGNNDRVQKFTSTGTYLTRLGSDYFFNDPLGIDVDASGNV